MIRQSVYRYRSQGSRTFEYLLHNRIATDCLACFRRVIRSHCRRMSNLAVRMAGRRAHSRVEIVQGRFESSERTFKPYEGSCAVERTYQRN